MRLVVLMMAVATMAAAGTAGAATSVRGDEAAIEKLIADYGRAIETKDVALFKAVKPNLSELEQRRTRAAFEAVKSQTVKITVTSMEVQGDVAVVRVSRRDTINGSLVSSFPQTFRLSRSGAGWAIVEIGK